LIFKAFICIILLKKKISGEKLELFLVKIVLQRVENLTEELFFFNLGLNKVISSKGNKMFGFLL